MYLPVAGAVETVKLLADLDRDEKKLRDEKSQCETRLANPSFLERAKPEAVEKERVRLSEIDVRLQTIAQRRELFS
jgi:valyl-tRNA synthetase